MAATDRFMRTRALLGEEKMSRLQQASVMIIGLGAVGGYALEALARAGIGHLTLVDFDVFDETNINRQILALDSTVGRQKTAVAAERVKDINPDCRVTLKNMFVNGDTLPQLFCEPVDFVVDAIDALNPKCNLMEYLYTRRIPFISSMGAALKSDTSKIFYGRLSQTKNCALAKFVRKRLKRRNVDISKINCVSSTEVPDIPETALFETEDAVTENGRIRKTMGSLPTITAIFGLMIANEVINFLAEKKNGDE